MNAENIQTAYNVIMNANQSLFYLGITMMKGREHKCRSSSVIANQDRATRRRTMKKLRKSHFGAGCQMLRGGRFDPALAIDRSEKRLRKHFRGHMFFNKNGSLNSKGTGAVRADAFRQNLDSLLYPHGLKTRLYFCVNYHSKSKSSGGTPCDRDWETKIHFC